jgi:hypothetical protein
LPSAFPSVVSIRALLRPTPKNMPKRLIPALNSKVFARRTQRAVVYLWFSVYFSVYFGGAVAAASANSLWSRTFFNAEAIISCLVFGCSLSTIVVPSLVYDRGSFGSCPVPYQRKGSIDGGGIEKVPRNIMKKGNCIGHDHDVIPRDAIQPQVKQVERDDMPRARQVRHTISVARPVSEFPEVPQVTVALLATGPVPAVLALKVAL